MATELTVEDLQKELEAERESKRLLIELTHGAGRDREEEGAPQEPWYDRVNDDEFDERQIALGRRIDEDLRGYIDAAVKPLREENARLRAGLDEATKASQASGELAQAARHRTAYDRLEREVPLGKLEKNDGFKAWADEVDFTSGLKYKDLVLHALKSGDGERAAALIKRFPDFEVVAGLKEPPKEEKKESAVDKLFEDLGDLDARFATERDVDTGGSEDEGRGGGKDEPPKDAAEGKAEAPKKDPLADRADLLPDTGDRDRPASSSESEWTPQRVEALRQMAATRWYEQSEAHRKKFDALHASYREHVRAMTRQ